MLSKIKNNVETIIFVVLAGIYLLAMDAGVEYVNHGHYSQEMATSSLMYD